MSARIHNESDPYLTDTLAAAQWWYNRGATVGPGARHRKGMIVDGWQKLERHKLLAHIQPNTEALVLRNGDGGWADADLDDDFAVRVAPNFLPRPGIVFGRIGNPDSHWLYQLNDNDERGYIAFADPISKNKLLELRAAPTHGTNLPGGTHSATGEMILMARGATLEPTSITFAELRRGCAKTAAVLLLRRYWPQQGSRQEATLALAGWLLRNAWTVEEVVEFVDVLTADGYDDSADHDKRIEAVHDTAQTLKDEELATGLPTLASLLVGDGEKLVRALAGWFQIDRPRAAPHGRDDDSGERAARGPSIAVQLIELADQAGCQFFHDTEREPWVTFPVHGHWETTRVNARAYWDWLEGTFHVSTGRTANASAKQDAQGVFRSRATYGDGESDSPQHAIHVRLAEHDGAIYLDLAEAERRVVRITAAGWQIVDDAPVKFWRPKGMLPLPLPVTGGTIDELWPFVYIVPEERPLLAGFLVEGFRAAERGGHPILAIGGEQGSAKSTLAHIVRRLVDPNVAPLRGAPHDGRDLAIQAHNARLLAYDNLSGTLPAWLSDGLCRISTGGGYGTRMLYENADEVLFDSTRPIILTSIADVATRSDLVDRCVFLTLPRITEDTRQQERMFWPEFERARPLILGVLLDAVAGALTNLDAASATAGNLPRMADFAAWAAAAEPALGQTPGRFLEAYRVNRVTANKLALDASLVGEALTEFVNGQTRHTWTGTMKTLLAALNQRHPENEKRPGWPHSPRALSGAIRTIAPNLRAEGYGVPEPDELIKRSGGTEWTICRLEETAPPPPYPPQGSPAQETSGLAAMDVGMDVETGEATSTATSTDSNPGFVPGGSQIEGRRKEPPYTTEGHTWNGHPHTLEELLAEGWSHGDAETILAAELRAAVRPGRVS